METILETPKAIRSGQRKKKPHQEDGPEDKVIHLYLSGHYTDEDMARFFSIPREHRADPFAMIEDGDIYWADKRNIRALETAREASRGEIPAKLDHDARKVMFAV